MKTQLSAITFFSIFFFSCQTPTPQEIAIQQITQQFVLNGDTRNINNLRQILHDDFRVAVNRAFGSDSLSIIDKEHYLALLNDGIIGGDIRTSEIKSINIDQHNAVVNVEITGKTTIFNSTLLFVQNKSGEWKILSDMPTVEQRQ